MSFSQPIQRQSLSLRRSMSIVAVVWLCGGWMAFPADGQNRNEDGRGSGQTENQEQPSNHDQVQTGIATQCPVSGVTVVSAVDGLKVVQVEPGSPADTAGVEEEDLLLSVGETEINSPDQLLQTMQQHQGSGEDVPMTLRRDGRTRQVALRLMSNQSSDPDSRQNPDFRNQQAPRNIRRNGQPGLGVVVTYSNGQGVHVDQVFPNSPAHKAGIRAGDSILAINEDRVTSPDALVATISNMDPQEQAAVTIWRSGQEEKVDVVLSTREEVFPQRTAAFRGPMAGPPPQEDLRAEIQQLQQQVREIQDKLRELENKQDTR